MDRLHLTNWGPHVTRWNGECVKETAAPMEAIIVK
ncbi:hypothetical protein TNCT_313791, partial [Trichonephila clavata]